MVFDVWWDAQDLVLHPIGFKIRELSASTSMETYLWQIRSTIEFRSFSYQAMFVVSEADLTVCEHRVYKYRSILYVAFSSYCGSIVLYRFFHTVDRRWNWKSSHNRGISWNDKKQNYLMFRTPYVESDTLNNLSEETTTASGDNPGQTKYFDSLIK